MKYLLCIALVLLICLNLVLADHVWSINQIQQAYLNHSEILLLDRFDYSKLEYFDTEEQYPVFEIHSTNILPSNSPLIDDFHAFYEIGSAKGYTDSEITLLIAISGTESSFGTKANYHNYWGIMCYRPERTLDCGWTNDQYAISRAFDLVGGYLRKWDGSQKGLEKVFLGSYCQSSCTNWVGNTWYFYNKLTN